MRAGLNFIRLATPTTDDKRLPAVLANTSGFVYYVSITGITGAAAPDAGKVGAAVARIKRHTHLPVAVGFGVRDAASAAAIAAHADGVVVGRRWSKRCAARWSRVAREPDTVSRGRRTRSNVTRAQACVSVTKPRGSRHKPMNWISNVVPPKIRSFLRRETPENLWVKCPESGQLVFHKDLEANLFVVPGSGYHMAIAPKARLAALFDDGDYDELPTPETPADPLKFRDIKRYADRLKEYRLKTGAADSITLAAGALEGQPVTVAVHDFAFQGGTLGMAAGEAIIAGMTRSAGAAHPVHHLHRFGRRAHAGRHVRADADAAHDGRGATAARGQAALYRRADQPDDRRRHRVLRDARRHRISPSRAR